MDNGSIIGLAIILMVVLPFILPSFFKKQTEKRLKSRLSHLAGSEGIEISDSDVWDKKHAIGIDDKALKVIFYSTLKKDETHDVINLNEVSGCRTVQADSGRKCLYGGPQASYRLYLVFSFKDSSRAEKAIEFYNNASFAPVEHDLVLIEKWVSTIRHKLPEE